MSRQVTQCPVCDAALRITELSCPECDTKLHGVFQPPPLARLSREHQQFIETFVLCRGVIRDMEKALGISYPTVRARLDAVVEALEQVLDQEAATPASPPAAEQAERRRALLQKVQEGLLSPTEAAESLRHL